MVRLLVVEDPEKIQEMLIQTKRQGHQEAAAVHT
jgi:hypothetical protein